MEAVLRFYGDLDLQGPQVNVSAFNRPPGGGVVLEGEAGAGAGTEMGE